jgi:adenine-specific DNA methylase
MALREQYLLNGTPILLPMDWTYRHPPAFRVSPGETLLQNLMQQMRTLLDLEQEPVVMLDSMAGGGVIPLEGVRYGLKIFAKKPF